MTEFARAVRVDTIGTEPRAVAIEAEESERAALAKRFDIVALDTLSATASVVRRGGDIVADGRLSARLVQACAATGVDMPAAVDAPFAVVFRAELPGEAEAELSEDECDVVFYQGGAIDLGEAVAETLALAIDPYPRVQDADAILRAAGVVSEEDAQVAGGPFAGLAGLR